MPGDIRLERTKCFLGNHPPLEGSPNVYQDRENVKHGVIGCSVWAVMPPEDENGDADRRHPVDSSRAAFFETGEEAGCVDRYGKEGRLDLGNLTYISRKFSPCE